MPAFRYKAYGHNTLDNKEFQGPQGPAGAHEWGYFLASIPSSDSFPAFIPWRFKHARPLEVERLVQESAQYMYPGAQAFWRALLEDRSPCTVTDSELQPGCVGQRGTLPCRSGTVPVFCFRAPPATGWRLPASACRRPTIKTTAVVQRGRGPVGPLADGGARGPADPSVPVQASRKKTAGKRKRPPKRLGECAAMPAAQPA